MRLHELQEQRAQAVAEMRGLADGADVAKRDLSEIEVGRFDALKGTVAGLDNQIVRAQTLQAMERAEAGAPVDNTRGAPDLSRYSLARALRCASVGRLDGIEGECHTELTRGREARGSVTVPTSILLGERRAQLVTPDTAGGYLVGTSIAASADRFRPALKVESMGATVLRNLVGMMDLPNLAASGSSHWVGEHQNTTRSSASFEKVSMSPKTVSAEYELSRRIQMQSGESIENLLRRDLGFLLAQALDKSAIKNGGSVNEPAGILDSGIAKTATATLLSDTAADLISALELDDVSGSRAFLTNPYVAGVARKLKDGDSRQIPLSETFHGERFEVTTQVPSNIGSGSNKSALIFGTFSELVVGYWSGVDILLNPYHSDVASKGGALLHAFLDADCVVRHVEAFSYSEIA